MLPRRLMRGSLPPPANPAESSEQNMDRLADEIFDRIRWRLAVERERHMA